MKIRVGTFGPLKALAAIALLSLLAVPARAGEAARKCCLTNPRYTGTCEVTLAESETCQGVLAYLNNPAAVGKQYCGNTNVRGGWKEATCQAPSQTSDSTAQGASACVADRQATSSPGSAR